MTFGFLHLACGFCLLVWLVMHIHQRHANAFMTSIWKIFKRSWSYFFFNWNSSQQVTCSVDTFRSIFNINCTALSRMTYISRLAPSFRSQLFDDENSWILPRFFESSWNCFKVYSRLLTDFETSFPVCVTIKFWKSLNSLNTTDFCMKTKIF